MGIYDGLKVYTAPALLRAALGKVTANVDKREGSVIYDALAPLSFVASSIIDLFRSALENTDLQTASGEWLDLIGSQPPVGIYRKQAVFAQKVAVLTPSTITLSNNTRFSSDAGMGLFWAIKEYLGNGRYILKCETEGAEPSGDYGSLTPVERIEGIKTFEFEDVAPIVWGEDKESDAAFRIRIWQNLKTNRYGGNFDDYKAWCLDEFPNTENGATVDGMLFFPYSRLNSNNYGRIIIMPTAPDASGHAYCPASQDACTKLSNYLDPPNYSGAGAGVSPVGHLVYVIPPVSDVLNLEVTVETWNGGAITDDEINSAKTFLQELLERARRQLVTTIQDEFPTRGSHGYLYTITYGEFVDAIIDETSFKSVFGIRLNGVELTADSVIRYELIPPVCKLPVLGNVSFVLE